MAEPRSLRDVASDLAARAVVLAAAGTRRGVNREILSEHLDDVCNLLYCIHGKDVPKQDLDFLEAAAAELK